MTKKYIKIKSKKFLTFDWFLSERLKNPAFKKAYLASQPKHDLIAKLIEKRIKRNLTQKQLAKKLGTKQSAISRFESGKGNPTVVFLHNLATALNIELEIRVVKKKSPSVL